MNDSLKRFSSWLSGGRQENKPEESVRDDSVNAHEHIFGTNGCWCGAKPTAEQRVRFDTQKSKLEADKLWQEHLSTVERFLEIAERKVSMLDDYGDERWELLPQEIAICITKISDAQRERIASDQLRKFRREGHPMYLPKEYVLLAFRLQAAFTEYDKQKSTNKWVRTKVLSGGEFEVYVVRVLKAHGYEISGTPTTGNQGADLIARKDGRTIAIQVKRYAGSVSNKAVQEVVAAMGFYGASEGWVITNAVFTPGAKALAQKNNVRLIDGSEFRSFESALSS